MNSTFSNYNCDNHLNSQKKIIWLFKNIFQNTCFFTKTKFKTLEFKHNKLNYIEKTIVKSPSRLLCDKFWENEFSNNSKIDKIKILEVGCGSGTYGKYFNNILGDKLEKYTGVDLHSFDDWKLFDEKFEFIKVDSKDIYETIKDLEIDLIITQSAIEHFDEDISFFEGIKKYKNVNLKTKQIHLFPAKKSIYLYLFHGVRQYNICNINKISNIFDNKVELYKLGSFSLNLFHLIFITIPFFILRLDLRSKFPKTYSLILKKILKFKIFNTPKNNTVFYALKIY